jgi:hypothetical protein
VQWKDSSGSAKGPVQGSCEYGNQAVISEKELAERVTAYQERKIKMVSGKDRQ